MSRRGRRLGPDLPRCPLTSILSPHGEKEEEEEDEVGGRPSLNLFQAWVHEHGVCVSVLPGV